MAFSVSNETSLKILYYVKLLCSSSIPISTSQHFQTTNNCTRCALCADTYVHIYTIDLVSYSEIIANVCENGHSIDANIDISNN